uniref:Uncharacterized protein n=1 Tax=Aegilops tauschii subsp. strangulata TaxID=200361 RepID=A0A453HCM1_AEGTS
MVTGIMAKIKQSPSLVLYTSELSMHAQVSTSACQRFGVLGEGAFSGSGDGWRHDGLLDRGATLLLEKEPNSCQRLYI